MGDVEGRQCKGAKRSGAPVQKWKGEVRGQSTDYGARVEPAS